MPLLLSMLGGMLLLAILLWPRHGLYAQWTRYRQLSRKEALEHVLKHLHHCEYLNCEASLESLAGAVGWSRNRVVALLESLDAAGLVTLSGGRVQLTAAGRREALRVIRIHRLWEQFFAERSGLHETLWHEEADRREHITSQDEMERLAQSLGNPRFDPHGAPIPTAAGELPSARGIALSSLRSGQLGRVVHVEDEPSTLHEQLVTQGLTVGALIRVLECDASTLRLEVGGEEQSVAMVAATNVSVEPLELPAFDPGRLARLSQIRPGQKARVVGLLPSCHGVQRRRLLDLGLVAGTVIEPELRSLTGDPTAYRVRGALVALRQSQAKQIHVERMEEERQS